MRYPFLYTFNQSRRVAYPADAAIGLALFGQSNCSGSVTAQDVPTHLQGVLDGVNIYNTSTASFEPYEAGVNSSNDSPGQWGPEAECARVLRSKTGKDVYIFKYGVSGSGLGNDPGEPDWSPDSGEALAQCLWHLESADAWAKAQGIKIAWRCVMPVNGEDDSNDSAEGDAYESRMREILRLIGLRTHPAIARVMVQLSDTYASGRPGGPTIQAAQAALGSEPGCAYVVTTGVVDMQIDDVHYSPTGLVQLGALLADECLKFVEGPLEYPYETTPPPPTFEILSAEIPAGFPDRIRLHLSQNTFWTPKKWYQFGDPTVFTGNRFGFIIDHNYSSDTIIEVREIAFNTFGNQVIDLITNWEFDEDSVLDISYDNTIFRLTNSTDVTVPSKGPVTVVNNLPSVIAARRYISDTGSDITGDGLTHQTAYKTLGYAATQVGGFPAHTKVLIDRGYTYPGQATTDWNISDIYFDSYGTGTRPVFDNSTTEKAAVVFQFGNSSIISNVKVRDLAWIGPNDQASKGRFVRFRNGNVSDSSVIGCKGQDGWNFLLTFRGGTNLSYVGCDHTGSFNSMYWYGGDNSVNRMLESCVMRDCNGRKVNGDKEDIFTIHPVAGSPLLNPALVGENNVIERCAGSVPDSVTSNVEESYDLTHGKKGHVRDCYGENLRSNGQVFAGGAECNEMLVTGCWFRGSVGIKFTRDIEVYNCVLDVDTAFIWRANMYTDYQFNPFNPNATFRHGNLTINTRNGHDVRRFALGAVINTGGATFNRIEVENCLVRCVGSPTNIIDYRNDGDGVNIDPSKTTFNNIVFQVQASLRDGAFCNDLGGNYTYAQWVVAEQATNCTCLVFTDPEEMVNTSGDFDNLEDFFLASSAVSKGSGIILAESDDDLFEAKKRIDSANDPDVGGFQSGFNYLS